MVMWYKICIAIYVPMNPSSKLAAVLDGVYRRWLGRLVTH